MPNDGVIRLPETAEPETPGTGFQRLYIDEADGELKKKDSSGTVVPLLPSSSATRRKTISTIIDGGGQVLQPGFAGNIKVPFDATIVKWYIYGNGNETGSAVVDVRKKATIPMSGADSIAGSEKPTLSSATSGSDTNLTTWTTGITAGQWVGFELESVSTFTWLKIDVEIEITV